MAHPYIEAAHAINAKIYGEDHQVSIISLDMVVKSHIARNEFKKALLKHKKVYYFFEKHLGGEHGKTKEMSAVLSELTRRAVLEVGF